MSLRECHKAQSGIEAIMSVLIVLIAFVFVVVNNSLWNTQELILEEVYSSENTCNKLGFVISQVYAAGDKTKIAFALDKNVIINKANKTIFVKDIFCSVAAALKEDENLVNGTVVIKNLNMEVDLQNV